MPAELLNYTKMTAALKRNFGDGSPFPVEEHDFKDLGKDIWIRLLQGTAGSPVSSIEGNKSDTKL